MATNCRLQMDRFGRTGQAAAAIVRVRAGKAAYEPPYRQASQAAPATACTAANARPAKPLTRVQVVAHAVETDPTCKGKAHLALAMLADDDMAAVNGSGIVKLLQRMPTAAGNDTDAMIAEMRALRRLCPG